MSAPRYFALLDEHGIDGAGDHEPIVDYALGIASPTMKGGEVVPVTSALNIKPHPELGTLPGRIIPDTRLLEIGDPRAAAAIAQDPKFLEVDKPDAKALAKAAEMTQPHRERRAGGTSKRRAGGTSKPTTQEQSTSTSGEEG